VEGYRQITREIFFRFGGFMNPYLIRVQQGNQWTYWERKR
jgi:hypothetical protein